MRRLPIILTFLGLFLSGILTAQQSAGQPSVPALRLADLIGEAKESNPAIRAAREKWLAGRQDVTVRSWWDQPVISGEYWFRNGSAMGELSQMIPFPAKTILARQSAASEAGAAEAELDLRTSEVINAVKKAFYMYYFTGKRAENARENLSLMKDIAASAEALYSSGRVPQSDVLSANAETARMQNMLLMLDADKASSRNELAALLGRTDAGTIGEPEFEFESFPDIAGIFTNVSTVPEVRMLAAMARGGRLEQKMAGWGWAPDFMIGVKYDSMQGPGLTAGLSIPLYLPKLFAEMKKAGHRYLSAAAMLKDAENMTRAGLAGLAGRFKAGVSACRNYRTVILPLSRQALILDQTSYAAGKTSFTGLRETSSHYLADKNEYYDLLSETWIMLAGINAMLGVE